MADRIEIFAVTVAPGTLQSATQIDDLSFQDGIVKHITVTIPPGPSGFMGFHFLHMGGPVIPYFGDAYIIGDNRLVEWDVNGMPTADGWQLESYNTDIFPHSVYIEFQIDEIPATAAASIQLINIT